MCSFRRESRSTEIALFEHQGAPACDTVKVRPAMLILAVRDELLVLAATVKVKLVGPVPLAGMPLTQDGTSLLVQGQSALVLTPSLLDSRLADALYLLELSE